MLKKKKNYSLIYVIKWIYFKTRLAVTEFQLYFLIIWLRRWHPNSSLLLDLTSTRFHMEFQALLQELSQLSFFTQWITLKSAFKLSKFSNLNGRIKYIMRDEHLLIKLKFFSFFIYFRSKNPNRKDSGVWAIIKEILEKENFSSKFWIKQWSDIFLIVIWFISLFTKKLSITVCFQTFLMMYFQKASIFTGKDFFMILKGFFSETSIFPQNQ